MITDLIHLYNESMQFSSFVTLFLVSLQFLALVLIGFGLFAASYHKFEKFIFKKMKITPVIYMWRGVMFGIVSAGVYLGRFIRFNSWDAVVQPLSVVRSLEALWSYHAFWFMSGFTIVLFLGYFMYEHLRSRILS